MDYKWLEQDHRRFIVNWYYVDRHIVNSVDDFNKELVGLKQIKPIKKNGEYTDKLLTAYGRETREIKDYAVMQNSYFVKKCNTEITACVCKKSICYKVVYKLKERDTSDDKKITGTQAFHFIYNLYQKKTKSRIDIYDDYGCSDELKFLIKNCVPSPINYVNPKFKYDEFSLLSCTKADVSSAYPFEATKPLPTLNDCLVVNGIEVAPSEQYPFAFYPKSGTLAIYNELDTHNLIGRPEYVRHNYKPDIVDNDMTILCKACDKTHLADIYKELYIKRNEIPNCKDYMNLSLGYMELNSDPILAHIKAVVVARCDTRVLAISDKLTERKLPIILIATDSVSWVGPNQPDIVDVVKDEDKYLGAFALEFTNGMMIVCGAKAYQYMTYDGKVKTKWAGVPKEYTEKLKWGEQLKIVESQGFEDDVPAVKWDYDKEILIKGVLSK